MSAGGYEIQITSTAEKDIREFSPKLKNKLHDILVEVISKNPHQDKKLIGDLEGYHSFRLNYQDRIVYRIDSKNKIVYIHRAKTHYGD